MRRRWWIPSVEMLKSMVLAKRCWKYRSKYRGLEEEQISKVGVATRNVLSIRISVARGLSSLSVEVTCRRTWNLLPTRIKDENDKEKAFRMIKNWVAKRSG